ncbi:MAG: hypothetical protein HYS45_00830 [Parcubacteria group bacterium]|nr:hypothetical protein [Parcubacteria group bacterium]
MNRFSAIALMLLSFVPQTAHAEFLRACTVSGNCGVCDIAATAVTLGKWLITGSAALALVVIVWASTVFATSAGNPEKIQEAKKQILGAVFGVGIVFAAFYLVLWIVMAFANPSSQFRYSEDPAAGKKVTDAAGLRGFLGGAAWWDLCSEADLRTNSDNPGSVKNETADCKFWGDDTSCSDKSNKVCCSGVCQDAPCVPSAGVAAPTRIPAAPGVPGAAGDEAATRSQLGTIEINKSPCPDINTSLNCTSVAGLSQSTINKLIEADGICGGCIIITGGTERGPHAENTTHGRPNVVDIGNSQDARTALEQMGLVRMTSFQSGYAMGSNWFICDTAGQAVSCSTASHLHVEF